MLDPSSLRPSQRVPETGERQCAVRARQVEQQHAPAERGLLVEVEIVHAG